MSQETSANSLRMLKLNLRVVFETYFVRGKSTDVALSGKRFLTFFRKASAWSFSTFSAEASICTFIVTTRILCFQLPKATEYVMRILTDCASQMKKVSSDAFTLKQGLFIVPFLWHDGADVFFWKPTPLIFQNFRVQRARWLVRASSKSGAMTMPRMFSVVREILVDGTEGRKM